LASAQSVPRRYPSNDGKFPDLLSSCAPLSAHPPVSKLTKNDGWLSCLNGEHAISLSAVHLSLSHGYSRNSASISTSTCLPRMIIIGTLFLLSLNIDFIKPLS